MTGHYVVIESVGKAVLTPFGVPQTGAHEVLIESEFTNIAATAREPW